MPYAINDLSVAFVEFERVLKPAAVYASLKYQTANRFGQWLLKNYAWRDTAADTIRFRQKATTTMWRYFWDSIEACVPPEHVLATLHAAKLTQVKRNLVLGIFSEYQAVKADPGQPNSF